MWTGQKCPALFMRGELKMNIEKDLERQKRLNARLTKEYEELQKQYEKRVPRN